MSIIPDFLFFALCMAADKRKTDQHDVLLADWIIVEIRLPLLAPAQVPAVHGVRAGWRMIRSILSCQSQSDDAQALSASTMNTGTQSI